MKEVLQKLFLARSRLDDAWACTRVDPPDTTILRHDDDVFQAETIPMTLMEFEIPR